MTAGLRIWRRAALPIPFQYLTKWCLPAVAMILLLPAARAAEPAVGTVVAWPMAGIVVGRWHAAPGPSAAWPVMLAVAVAAGVLVRAARAVPRAGLFLVVGAAVGVVVVLAR